MGIFPGTTFGNSRRRSESWCIVVAKPNSDVSISVAELGMRSSSHEIGEESTLIPPLSTLELSSSSTTHIPEQDIAMGSPADSGVDIHSPEKCTGEAKDQSGPPLDFYH
jgi:hypothetical protein